MINSGEVSGVVEALEQPIQGDVTPTQSLTGEVQQSSYVGGVKDVQVNDVSVVDENKVAKIDLTPYAEKEDVYDKQTIDTALEGKANTSDIPTALSQLDNDDNYVQDENYVHTDNNFTDEDKAAIGGIPENITDLSDVEVSNIQNGQVLKWDSNQNKFVNANESGGGSGDVADVKVNGTSVVDPITKEANIDLSGYAETTDIHNPTITIQKNGQNVDTFTLNQTTDKVIDISVPTKTSDLQNDSSFITNTVNNLANYYLKSQTYTQAEVDALIDAAVNGRFQKVNVLPATGEPNIIYLVPKATPETSNACDEYIWQDNDWELIGSTDIDLSGYVTDDELNTALADYLTTSAFNTAIANYYNKTEIGNLLDGKVDKVSGKGLSTNDYDNTAKGIVDGVTSALAGKVDKETGKGLSTNDYTTTEKNKVATIDNKADKVTNATNGNLAGLNGSGNLTDSGWNGAKDTTSISGNPISISGLKANQLAVNPIITLEPIQAGSGTPSPSNVRAISGYDKVDVLSCGKNLACNFISQTGYNMTVTRSGNNISFTTNDRGGAYITTRLKAGKTYVLNYTITSGSFTNVRLYSDFIASKNLGSVSQNQAFTPSEDGYIRFWLSSASTVVVSNLQLEESSTSTTYEAPNKTTDLSESLGQTVYGATWYPRTGELRVTLQIVDLGDLTYTYNSQYQYFYAEISSMADSGYGLSDRYQITTASYDGNQPDNSFKMSGTGNKRMFITNRAYDNATTFKTAMVGAKVVYELATPFTIQLTPHEISLLKDYAYVSTNGTNISLDYHNGELASLADVSQLGETVNELGNRLDEAPKRKVQIDITSYVGAGNEYDAPYDGYITLNSGSSTTGTVGVYLYDEDMLTLAHQILTVTGANQELGIFIKKSTKCRVIKTATNATVYFRGF